MRVRAHMCVRVRVFVCPLVICLCVAVSLPPPPLASIVCTISVSIKTQMLTRLQAPSLLLSQELMWLAICDSHWALTESHLAPSREDCHGALPAWLGEYPSSSQPPSCPSLGGTGNLLLFAPPYIAQSLAQKVSGM